MYIQSYTNTTYKVESLQDLKIYKSFMEAQNLKINKSKIARDLNVDRRSVDKYLDGYTKPKTRKRRRFLDDYYDIISELLNSETQIFHYKRILWQYLTDNHNLVCPQSTFRQYIAKKPEFQRYFNPCSSPNNGIPVMRVETPPAEQAQLDWKEDINFKLKNGENISINILVLLLSYSRFKVFKLSLSKEQTVLQSLLTESFEAIGGVPKTIVTDNMKTVMTESRTKHNKGKTNKSFEEFAKDFNFKIQPCIAKRPQTKGKVESQMKFLDEIQAYSGQLDLIELYDLVDKINTRVNSSINQGSNNVPFKQLPKEKEFLTPLPCDTVKNSYKIATYDRKINTSAMINYNNCQYSVPPEYIGKTAKLQVYNNNLYIYYNTKLISMHAISSNKLNYNDNHYKKIVEKNFGYKNQDEIEKISKENLIAFGGFYDE